MVTAKVIKIFENGKPKLLTSETAELLWRSVSVTSDGNDNGCDITEVAGDFAFNGKRLTNLADPVSGQDAATKAYVDTSANGYDPKDSVDYATAAALPAVTYNNGSSGVGATLTANANGALVIDGITVPENGRRVLVKNQAAGLQNGIYVVTEKGDGSNPFVLTRAVDFDNSPDGEISQGARTTVVYGNTLAGWVFYCNVSGSITVGTTAITFSVSDSTPTATSASGGGTTGKVTFDSDKGLEVVGGVAAAKVDNSTLEFGSGNIRQKDGGTTLAKLASDSVDETKIKSSALNANDFTGGSGTVIAIEKTETATNNTGSTINAGKLVFLREVGGAMEMFPADADDGNASDSILGVLVANTVNAASGSVITRKGTKVTPSGGGSFVRGGIVYVSETAGDATQTPPAATNGKEFYVLGRAINTTQVRLDQEYQGTVVTG